MFGARLMTDGDIKSIEYMGGGEDLKKRLVAELARKLIITEDFMKKYGHLLEREVFSSSPFLQKDIIKKYPDLFDKGIWIATREKSLDTLFDPDVLSSLDKEERLDAFHNFNVSRLAGPEGKNISYKNLKDISGIRSVILPLFPEAVNDLTEDDMENLDESIFEMSSISEHLKEKSLVEKLIKTKKDINAKFFFLALLNCDNIGWQNRMLKEAWDLKWESTAATSEIAKKVFAELAEDQILPSFLIMKEYAPNFLSYDSLTFLLQAQELSENTVLEMIEEFVKKGVGRELEEYCKDRDYSASLLKLSI